MKHLRPKWWLLRAKPAALPWKIAVSSLAAALVGLAAFVFLAATSSMIEKAQLSETTEVLADKARESIQTSATPTPPADSASAFDIDLDLLSSVEKSDKPLPHWDEIARSRPSPLGFWYRQSPEPMQAVGFPDEMLIPGIVREEDPVPITSRMIHVRLDPQGWLTFFEALPAEKEDAPIQTSVPDWKALFAAAGLDISKFQTAAPLWASLAASDARQAWTGEWPGYQPPPAARGSRLSGMDARCSSRSSDRGRAPIGCPLASPLAPARSSPGFF